MGADKSAENTPNAPKFICPLHFAQTKRRDFNEKRVHWASVVRAHREEYKDIKDQKVWATDFENSKTELGINHGNMNTSWIMFSIYFKRKRKTNFFSMEGKKYKFNMYNFFIPTIFWKFNQYLPYIDNI